MDIMRSVLIAASTLIVGAVLGIVLSATAIHHPRKQLKELQDTLNNGGSTVKQETMKRVVWACVGNGFAWVWCSYILAALDKPQIAEELSKVALAEIIVPVAVYALKSGVENLSKNNRWPDKLQSSENGPPEDEGGVG